MTKTKQIAWLLWLLTCTSLSVFIGYGASCAHAQTTPTQIVPNVPCPQTALCAKNEKGIWIPYWYARALLKVKTLLNGTRADLEKANSEIAALRVADAEHVAAVIALEENLAYEAKKTDIFRVRAEEAEKDNKRRLRWAVSTSVVGTVVIGVLTAILASH